MSPLRMFRRKKTRESVKQKPQNQAPSSSGRLMLALEPRYLYDAAGLATGLDIVAPAEDHYVPPVDDGHSDWQDISDELALLKDFTPPAVTSPEELVFIDPGVEDVQTLLAGISSEAEIVFLEPDRDGVLQVSEILSKYSGIEAIHILSHGEAGSFSLGGTELSSDTISEYASHLQSWAASLTENADILIYSCNVAANEAGVAFVAELSALTGADVAASEDLTGSAAEGGDWELEV
ncbi:MAG: DUF4347 domain-containing protein, partial [Desulfobulbaceae bacterium]|nr:DUF4347 domain-containing protein [Desulfobulbaceae bacterium]